MSDMSKVLAPIGFLGLGAMGSRMARNLLRAGYPLYGFDIDPQRLAAIVADGAVAAANAAEVVRCAEVVLTSLPSSESFVQVAEESLLPNARADQIFIDLGTTTPPETHRLAAAFKAQGATLLDVPVSGWITGAEQGTLRMFVGGDEATFVDCLPILEVLGDPEYIIYCGSSGAGQVVKGVNQLASGLGAAAYLEAIAFGVRAGVDPEVINAAVGGGDGWRQHFRVVARQVVAGKGDQVGVKFRELPYYLGEAQEQGFELPLTQTLYAFCDAGERVVIDDNRPAPSFWHELLARKAISDGNDAEDA